MAGATFFFGRRLRRENNHCPGKRLSLPEYLPLGGIHCDASALAFAATGHRRGDDGRNDRRRPHHVEAIACPTQ